MTISLTSGYYALEHRVETEGVGLGIHRFKKKKQHLLLTAYKLADNTRKVLRNMAAILTYIREKA